MDNEGTRFNKYVAQKYGFSRREADKLIESGKILLNGVVMDNPAHRIIETDTVALGFDENEYKNKKTYIVLNKPPGYVCSTNSSEGIPIRTLLSKSDNHVSPIGRLDKDSSGLIILSDDGTLTTAIIGEDSNVQKEYYVKVSGEITDGSLEKLRQGVNLWGEKTKPAYVRRLGRSDFMITISEGKNRQIRRMCQKVGNPVVELIRVRVGNLHLEKLERGKWRYLSQEEVRSIGD